MDRIHLACHPKIMISVIERTVVSPLILAGCTGFDKQEIADIFSFCTIDKMLIIYL